MMRGLLLTLLATSSVARPRVVVIKSAELAPYAQAIAGFSAEVKAEVSEVVLEEGAEAAQKALKRLATEPPALVLAVGPSAAVNARRQLPGVPIVFMMVPYFQKYDLEGANTTGVALTSDLSLELTALRVLAPRVKRLGLVMDPRFSKGLAEEASLVAQSRGLSVVPLELDTVAKLEKLLASAKGRVDGFVVVSDKTVGNAAVLERLLAFARAESLPVVGLSATQVRQGALFSLAPAPLSIGLQAGRVANRILVEKIDPGALAVAPPEGVELTVSLSAATRLGLGDGFTAAVLNFAAQQTLVVRPIE